MKKQLIIIGARSMGREVCNYARDCGMDVKGFLDSESVVLDGFVGYPQVISSVEEYEPRECDVFVCAIGDPAARKKYVECISQKGGKFVSVVHPSAYVGANVDIGDGVLICPNATLTCDVKLAEHVIVNVNSSVSHDCTIGSYCSISPGVSIAGRVSLGVGVFVGVGAKVMPDVNIGSAVVVGAGAVVTKSWGAGTIMGVPARLIF